MKNPRLDHALILAAFAAFVVANLIHNRFRVDAAVLPGALFVGLLLWRPWRVFQVAAAVFIALPALAFFKASAIADPSLPTRFFNHLFLLIAGVLAIAGGVFALLPSRWGASSARRLRGMPRSSGLQ